MNEPSTGKQIKVLKKKDNNSGLGDKLLGSDHMAWDMDKGQAETEKRDTFHSIKHFLSLMDKCETESLI